MPKWRFLSSFLSVFGAKLSCHTLTHPLPEKCICHALLEVDWVEIRINYRADFAHGIFFITVLHTSILVWNATVFPNPERMDFHSEHYNGFRCLETIMAFLPRALDLSLEGWGSLLKVWEGSFSGCTKSPPEPGLQMRGLKFQSSNSNSRELELTNLLGLALGCIEAKFCK